MQRPASEFITVAPESWTGHCGHIHDPTSAQPPPHPQKITPPQKTSSFLDQSGS